jgi:protein-disulfide isomerase
MPKLRIWFERPERGWSVAGPDVVLTLSGAPESGDSGAQMSVVLAELRELRALIEGKPTTTPTLVAESVTVSIAGAPATGSAEAPLALVEFTDFQCPYSISFEKTMAALKTKYVDAGKLRLFTRNLPQPFHPLAVPAARAALCAEQQERFWPMRERLFAANGALSPYALRQAAADAGLDREKFDACLASSDVAALVDRDTQDARAAGMVASPTIVVGRVEGDKVTGVKLVGAQPLVRIEIELRKLQQPSLEK